MKKALFLFIALALIAPVAFAGGAGEQGGKVKVKKIAFFVTLGACLVGLAVALNVTWVVLNWRAVVPLVLGVIFFGLIIAGLIVYTVFLVREIHRNEQQDSFLNAVTHELKTPVASIRLYLETLLSRDVEEPKRNEFYRTMLDDSDRLLGTIEQVLRTGRVGPSSAVDQQLRTLRAACALGVVAQG